jgi:hypothetical protein
MGNEGWGMGNGEWGMRDGEWGMRDGEWGMRDGDGGLKGGEGKGYSRGMVRVSMYKRVLIITKGGNSWAK